MVFQFLLGRLSVDGTILGSWSRQLIAWSQSKAKTWQPNPCETISVSLNLNSNWLWVLSFNHFSIEWAQWFTTRWPMRRSWVWLLGVVREEPWEVFFKNEHMLVWLQRVIIFVISVPANVKCAVGNHQLYTAPSGDRTWPCPLASN